MDMYDKLDNILQKRGMSRRQLAIDAKIPPATLQSALARKKNMSMEMLLKITTALQIPISEIMDEEDLWGVKAKIDIANQSEDFALKQINNLLSDEEKSDLLGSLGATLEYIYRYKSNPEAVQRLSGIISVYGKMIIASLEMRLGRTHLKDDYFLFLQYYDRCIEMLNTHKRELLDATLNFRNGDPELRKLIYGEDKTQ